MAKWQGKSRGLLIGYKIFIFILNTLGVQFAYFVLRFITFYYFVFSRGARKLTYIFFKKRLGYTSFQSFFSVYKNNYVFAQTIMDRFVISLGIKNKFTFEYDGVHHLEDMLEKKQGGVLISAHVGNFEIAHHFFSQMDGFSQINLVTTDAEHQKIKEFVESLSMESRIKFIIVGDDMSHIFEINQALSDNELVCFTGDRYFEGNRTLKADLLGKEAEFPAGPFLISSRLKVPVAFVYVMKETKTHYHLYTRMAEFENRNEQQLLESYTKSIGEIIKKYPYQWFNYFDFWDDIKDDN